MPSPSPLVLQDGTADQPIGPAMSRVRSFPFQSYFDSGLGAHAILPQPTNSEGFVVSTLVEEQIQGYGISLHPDSEVPVALQFRGGVGGDSGTFILRPGQSIRPSGLNGGSFDGFRWGLPFGWLGGGLAHLVVALTPDAKIEFGSQGREVIIQRLRLKVHDPAGAIEVDPNWPLRFPWPSAVASLSGAAVDQRGNPLIAPVATRVVMRLADTPAAVATMRMVWSQTDALDLDPTGTFGVRTSYFDVAWPTPGVVFPANPVIGLAAPELIALGGDEAILSLVDLSGGSLIDQPVDIVRYGLI